MSKVRAALILLIMAFTTVAVPSMTGCGRTLTPAEVEATGTRSFRGRRPPEVTAATQTALRTLGYEVIVADAGKGRIKTAPKALMVHATGGYGHAVAVTNEIAWTVEITPSADGVSVRAIPRAISGGQTFDGPWDADYLEKLVSDLFREIDSNLAAPAAKAGRPHR